MEPSGMGSLQVGSDEDLYAILTASTLAALENTITKCVTDGRAFTLRFYFASTTQVVSTIISPATALKFAYKLCDVDASQRDLQAQQLLDSIIESGEVSIGIPEH